MTHKLYYISIIILIAFFLSRCSQQKTVTRIDPSTNTDLSGVWNDTDSRLVANEMIDNILSERWLFEYKEAKKKIQQ